MSKRGNRQHNKNLRLAAITEIENNPDISGYELARRLEIRRNTAYIWLKIYRTEGGVGLLELQYGGKRRLTLRQIENIKRTLRSPATEYGFQDKEWTASKAKVFLEQKYGIKYKSVAGVRVFLRNHGIPISDERKSIDCKSQFQALLKILQTQSPRYYGFNTDIWTIDLAHRVGKKHLNIEYSASRIYGYLRELGWCFQGKHKSRSKKRAAE